MEQYYSKGGNLFLGLDPPGSGLEEAKARTVLSTSPAKEVFVLMIIIT